MTLAEFAKMPATDQAAALGRMSPEARNFVTAMLKLQGKMGQSVSRINAELVKANADADAARIMEEAIETAETAIQRAGIPDS